MNNLSRRKLRSRAKAMGDDERPRLSVFISNRRISAQFIDDQKGETIASVSTVSTDKESTTETAARLGIQIAKEAKKHKISKIRFDRNGKLYHGRLKALADAARKEGLEF